MRATLIRLLPLPPVPPRSTWSRAFPANNFNIVNRLSSPCAIAIGKGKRTQVADPALAKSVVNALDIRSHEIVLEAYPGMGFLTRAMLDLPPASHPRRIITVEPSVDFNVNGLGLAAESALSGFSVEDEQVRAKQALLATRRTAMRVIHDGMMKQGDNQSTIEHPDPATEVDQSKGTHIFRAFPSADEPSLTIVDGTMFDWKTLPAFEAQGLLDDVQASQWRDEPPNLHLVAQVPDSDMGEQLVSQWIGCVASQSWLFRFGRVKMSFLVKPTLYDRLCALPGTRAYSKLSVITTALCEVHPGSKLYPPGPDSTIPTSILKKREKKENQTLKTEPLALRPRKTRTKGKTNVEPARHGDYPADALAALNDPLLSTDPELWHPKPRRTATEQKQPPRPGMMVLTLIPRIHSQILPEDKDVWDYVLRRMFVNPGSPLALAINNLGMGATNLVPKLTNPSLPPHQRIDPEKWIREYSVQDWALVVEAFKAWPFAPDVLVLSGLMDDDNDTRQVGSGM